MARPEQINRVIRVALYVLLSLAGSRIDAERLPIRAYTTADGLPRDFISRIVQDSKGFLWFCTIEGLSRFDGYEFKNYGIDQGLPSRYVNDFLETRSGFYWVATSEGICRFDPYPLSGSGNRVDQVKKRFEAYVDNSARVRSVTVLLEDRQGTVWCGTSAGLYRLDMVDGTWVLSSTAIIPSTEGIGSIVEDRKGSLWVTTGIALYRYRPDGVVERYADEEGLPAAAQLQTLLAGRDGQMWVGTWNGLYRLVADPKPHTPVVARVYTTRDGLASDAVFSLFQTSDGRLWAGVGGRLVSRTGGLSEFLPDTTGRSFRTYAIANGLSDVDISTMAEDRDGNLWLGTETSGAMRLTLSGLTSYDEMDGFNKTRVRAIFDDWDGQICLIGKPGVIEKFDGNKFNRFQMALPPSQAYWGWAWNQIVLKDHLGELWMASAQGLLRFGKFGSVEQLSRAHPRVIYTIKQGLPSDEVFRIFEDSRGDIWIGTLGNPKSTLSRWERATSRVHVYPSSEGLPEASPTAFCEDPSGNLWIGFYSGGLMRYTSGRFTDFTKDLPRLGLVRALYLDRAKRLWIATDEGGVIRTDNPAADHPYFISYSAAQGLSSNQATCLTEDQWGRIYIGTGQGVNRLDVESGNITRYTTGDGLSNSYVYVSHRDRQGALWFGTFSGLSRLIPRLDPRIAPPAVLITGLRLSGEPQLVSELGASQVTLPDLTAGQNHIQIDFVGFGFRAGDALRYQYKFEGGDWSAPTDQRTVTYPSLPPGSYRFLVRAISGGGVVSDSPAIISFKILSPIWIRWWFLGIASAVVITIAIAVIRQRTARRRERERARDALRQAKEQRLRELEQVRSRIAADLHDDIGSNLTRISLISEVAQRKLDGADPPIREQLSNIGKLSRELVDSMSEIVWAINPNKDHLGDLSQKMRHFASDLLTARQIDFQFRALDFDREIKVGANLRREFFLIFKEGVNNIVRHSACTKAEIELRSDGDNLILTLTDNGKGFDVTEEALGHGLVSMRDRTQSLGGGLEVDSVVGAGTTLRFSIPLRSGPKNGPTDAA